MITGVGKTSYRPCNSYVALIAGKFRRVVLTGSRKPALLGRLSRRGLHDLDPGRHGLALPRLVGRLDLRALLQIGQRSLTALDLDLRIGVHLERATEHAERPRADLQRSGAG